MRKRVVVALVVCVVLLTSLVNYAVWSNPGSSEIPIEKYSFATLDDYIILKVTANSEYKAIDGETGEVAYTGTGLVATIQWAHDQLSSGGSIGIKHDDYFTNKEWEDQLNITNNGISLHSTTPRAGTNQCTFRAIDSLDKDMILITGDKCSLSYMTFSGNQANQASGRGIYDNSGGSGDLHMSHVYVFLTKNEGILTTGEGSNFYAVYVEYCQEEGWVIKTLRSLFIGCWACANVKQGFLVQDSTKNTFLGCNADDQTGSSGHGWLLQNTAYNRLIGCGARANEGYGFCLYGASNNTLSGLMVLDNTDNGIHFLTYGASTYSQNNTIQGAQILDNGNYGIYEADSNQDYNTIIGCNVHGHSTVDIKTQGANTHVNLCWNGTSWIA